MPMNKDDTIETSACEVVTGPRGMNQAHNKPKTATINIVTARLNRQSDQMCSSTMRTMNILGKWVLW
jgi:hypothetical protein